MDILLSDPRTLIVIFPIFLGWFLVYLLLKEIDGDIS
jgi:hypothetical protein